MEEEGVSFSRAVAGSGSWPPGLHPVPPCAQGKASRHTHRQTQAGRHALRRAALGPITMATAELLPLPHPADSPTPTPLLPAQPTGFVSLKRTIKPAPVALAALPDLGEGAVPSPAGSSPSRQNMSVFLRKRCLCLGLLLLHLLSQVSSARLKCPGLLRPPRLSLVRPGLTLP